MATRFSINLNKFALLRNARGSNMPDVLATAERCIQRGVRGITVHPRPDERHTRTNDVMELAALARRHAGVEFNVEGNPTERFLELVEKSLPHQVTLVPDAPGQLTSDHGWDAMTEAENNYYRDDPRFHCLRRVTERLHARGIRVSLFLDPVAEQVLAAAESGAERIELYTEPYASAFGTPGEKEQLERFVAAATLASELGLGVNAGHDLNLDNLPGFLRHVPCILEVSIGHAVICEAIDQGLDRTLARYLEIVGPQD